MWQNFYTRQEKELISPRTIFRSIIKFMSRKNKKKRPLISFALLFIATVFFSLLAYFKFITRPINLKSSEEKVIVIKRGATISQIGNTLEEQNLIYSTTAFKIVVYRDNLTKKIQAGSFRLSPSQSTQDIALSLTKGRLDQWLTIPEGYRNEEIAEEIEEVFQIPAQDFLSTAKGLQGMLFPDTYLIPLDATADQIINIMLSNYQDKTENYRSSITNSNLTEEEILSLAAIVERETLSDQEKSIVAGILLKRLANNWPLQVDASLQYIIGEKGEWWPIPTIFDKEISSPYNTYKNLGLTPTPIANSGIASIKAVINSRESDYWYYLHDSNGKIHYAEDLDQHNENIRKYIR